MIDRNELKSSFSIAHLQTVVAETAGPEAKGPFHVGRMAPRGVRSPGPPTVSDGRAGDLPVRAAAAVVGRAQPAPAPVRFSVDPSASSSLFVRQPFASEQHGHRSVRITCAIRRPSITTAKFDEVRHPMLRLLPYILSSHSTWLLT